MVECVSFLYFLLSFSILFLLFPLLGPCMVYRIAKNLKAHSF